MDYTFPSFMIIMSSYLIKVYIVATHIPERIAEHEMKGKRVMFVNMLMFGLH